MDQAYVDTVRLMLRAAPHVLSNPVFAMKGGTALNVFLHDLPRLSVDIDLVFTDHAVPRGEALIAIKDELEAMVLRLRRLGLNSSLTKSTDGSETKLTLVKGNDHRTKVKIEINQNFRGTLLPVQKIRLAEKARDMFATDVEVPSLTPAELYGGKMVAALDRQHPRDFFDVREMFHRGYFGPTVVDCFVGYLAGQFKTPIHSVLFSEDRDISLLYKAEFNGITAEEVSLADLELARTTLRAELFNGLEDRHKEFLLGVARLEVDWDLMPFPHLCDMPAVRRRLENLENKRKRNPEKFRLEHSELAKRFRL
jgi:hypothetical protein